MLKLQLTRRFGQLPRWAVTRVESVAMAQLDQWLTGIFDMQSLEEVLGPGPREGLKSRPH